LLIAFETIFSPQNLGAKMTNIEVWQQNVFHIKLKSSTLW
jgi:hypothetical protein